MARVSGIPAMQVDVDVDEAMYAMGYIREFTTQMSTQAYVRGVIEATHETFSDRFDRKMALVAKMNPSAYHHIYEYSPTGDGYGRIGDNKYKLWKHTRVRVAGHQGVFSWNWQIAKEANPTYQQRRKSKVGWDAIRDISLSEYRKLLKAVRENGGQRKAVFRRKAIMMEYGISAHVEARKQALFLPMYTDKMHGGLSSSNSKRVKNAGDATAVPLFKKSINTTSIQQPGHTKGNFTAAWVGHWIDVQNEWDSVLGNHITNDAEKRIAAASRAGKTVRKRNKTFGAGAAATNKVAFAKGEAKAKADIKKHIEDMKINQLHRSIFG